jgi:hypothetical protein
LKGTNNVLSSVGRVIIDHQNVEREGQGEDFSQDFLDVFPLFVRGDDD